MTKYKGIEKVYEGRDKKLTIELRKVEPFDFIETYILLSSAVVLLFILLIAITQ